MNKIAIMSVNPIENAMIDIVLVSNYIVYNNLDLIDKLIKKCNMLMTTIDRAHRLQIMILTELSLEF